MKGKATTGKRTQRSARTSQKDCTSATVPDSTVAVGNVSESEASSISSNSAEPPLEVLMTNMSSSTVPSEPIHEITEQQLTTSELPSVPSQVWYNPAYIQPPAAFLAQVTAPATLIRSMDPIDPISSSHCMATDGSSNDFQFAEMSEAEEEDAFDVAIRELFS